MISASEHAILQDLMRKVGDDVEAAIDRVLQIAPRPFLPMLLQASAVCVSGLTVEIEGHNNHRNPGRRLTPQELTMLSALMAGRALTEGELDSALQAAHADIVALKAGGRLPR
ncbi:hypothetical protein [Bradyrhizobium neotropicale]|uniref:hypothetical protein n=1 Tax=Bradyrhizobium neotropicale TaxID=1497615 RepID=UPI001AD7E1F6|nr:hypothetical protein [Bradyrhizobium neotropicale]MBO4222004.1 hypothetical protein [Bradyrhizobium neotropicale]